MNSNSQLLFKGLYKATYYANQFINDMHPKKVPSSLPAEEIHVCHTTTFFYSHPSSAVALGHNWQRVNVMLKLQINFEDVF